VKLALPGRRSSSTLETLSPLTGPFPTTHALNGGPLLSCRGVDVAYDKV
jgi:hypothetical protein